MVGKAVHNLPPVCLSRLMPPPCQAAAWAAAKLNSTWCLCLASSFISPFPVPGSLFPTRGRGLGPPTPTPPVPFAEGHHGLVFTEGGLSRAVERRESQGSCLPRDNNSLGLVLFLARRTDWLADGCGGDFYAEMHGRPDLLPDGLRLLPPYMCPRPLLSPIAGQTQGQNGQCVWLSTLVTLIKDNCGCLETPGNTKTI